MVSVTMETTGTMLVGTDIAAVVSILEPFPIDILGLNCATGPEQMKEHIRYLSEHSPSPSAVFPTPVFRKTLVASLITGFSRSS